MNRLTFLLACLAGLFARPAKAITQRNDAQWLRVTLQAPQGPRELEIMARVPMPQNQGEKTI